jgi:hypothetical protein
LAYALSNLAQLAMLAHDVPACVRHGQRALQLARQFDDVEVQVHALNNLGTTLWGQREARGHKMLEESLQLAMTHNMQEHAARAYTNLAFQAGSSFAFAVAESYYEAGIRYCEDRELDFWAQYMRACRTQVWLDQGRWPAAEAEARALLAAQRLAPISKIAALTVLARILIRTGSGRATKLLDEAAELAARSGDLIRIAPVACARAEAAWLAASCRPWSNRPTSRLKRWVTTGLAANRPGGCHGPVWPGCLASRCTNPGCCRSPGATVKRPKPGKASGAPITRPWRGWRMVIGNRSKRRS